MVGYLQARLPNDLTHAIGALRQGEELLRQQRQPNNAMHRSRESEQNKD
jgi:hypothetical protein